MDIGKFRVACRSAVGGSGAEYALEGKVHAHLIGAQKTACGFGLGMMRTFSTLYYMDQPPSARCSICDRHVRAARR